MTRQRHSFTCIAIVAVVFALASRVDAQTTSDSVVQASEVLVTGAAVATEVPGETTVALRPETDAPSSDWGILDRNVPNFHAFESGSGGYGGLFVARGLSNTPYFSDPAVTVYLDAIPLPSSFTYPEGIIGLESASAFLGPQGTEFGRATDGGVIHFEMPDSASGAEVIAMGGSYDLRQSALRAGTDSKGSVDVMVAAEYDAREGYIQNQTLGTRVDDQENENAFGRVRFRPKTGDEVSVEWLQTRGRDGAQPLVPLGGPLYVVHRSMEGVTDLDSIGIALKGTFSLPGSGSFTTDTSYTDWSMNPYQSFLILPPPLTNDVLQDQKHWNEELHFTSDRKAAFRVDAGAWLSKGTTQNFTERAIPGLFPVDASSFTQADRSTAVFATAAYDPNPRWTLEAGLRAEEDSKDFARLEYVPNPGLTFDGTGRYDALLPKASSRWQLSRESTLDATVAMGFRPGGFASFTDNPSLIPFSPERTTEYVLEDASTFANGAVTVSATIFYDAITNLQIERSFTPADYLVATAPRAHTEGGEVAAHWMLTHAWSVTASAGWTHARLDTFVAPITRQNESGNAAPNSPTYDVNVALSYRAHRGWFGSGQVSAVGATHFDELGSPKYTQAPYALLGLTAGYETERWSLTLFGENLGKAGYYELIIPGVNSGEPGAPRTVGAKAAFRF